jgi:ATP-dependent DNA ligase
VLFPGADGLGVHRRSLLSGPPRSARLLTPTVLVEVSYQEVTDDGLLRHQRFERFRF